MTREWILQSGTSRKGGITVGLTSLLFVAIGLFLLVGLIQSRFALGSSSSLMDIGGLSGFFQGSFGWIPSFYFSLLLLIWGGLSFVNGELADPLKRVLASVCFLFFFSGLVASLGGTGGSVGGGASASMAALIGVVPSGFFFVVLSLLGLFLSTDWFFYKGFKRFLLPVRIELPEDAGLAEEEESLLLGEVEKQTESTAKTMPRKPSFPVGRLDPGPAKTEAKPVPPRERIRRDRRAPSALAPSPEVPAEDAALDEVLRQARSALEEERKEIFVFHEKLASELVPEEAVSEEAVVSESIAASSHEDDGEAEEVWEGELGSSPVEDGPVPEENDEDLFSTLENESLLEAAGKALDKILEEEGPHFHQTTLEEMKEVVLEPKPRLEREAEREIEPKIEIYNASSSADVTVEPVPAQSLLFPETPPEPEMVHRAAQILLTSRRPLPSLLQRRLGIGLAEAREIFSCLKALGALEEPEGRGPWEPLMTLPEWEEVASRELGKSPSAE